MNEIGEKIKSKRIELKMTQSQLAKSINVSNKLISKWERGGSIPSIDYLNSLCKALNVDINFFFDNNTQNVKDEVKQQSIFNSPFFKTKSFKIILPIFCCLIILLISLTTFVFIPKAKYTKYEKYRDKYLETMNESILYNLSDLKYYNIELQTFVDKKKTNTNIWQGYIEEDGKVVYKNDNFIVKDNLKTDTFYKYDYIKPENIVELKDLFASEFNYEGKLKFSDEDIKYIEKKFSGYYIELSNDVFLNSLSTQQKNDIKLLDKIKMNFIIKNKHFKELNLTIKYRDEKEKENFVVESKLKFIFKKPVIEHENIISKPWSVQVDDSKEGFVKMFAGNSANLLAEKTKSYANYNYQSGYSYYYNDETLSVLKSLDDGIVEYLFDTKKEHDFYIWNDFVYSVGTNEYDYSEFIQRNILTGEKTILLQNPRTLTVEYNQQYASLGYLIRPNQTQDFYYCYYYDLSENTPKDVLVRDKHTIFIDNEGNEYYRKVNRTYSSNYSLSNEIYLDNQNETITFKGFKIRQKDNLIITNDKKYRYIYSNNTLIKTEFDSASRIDLDENSYTFKNESAFYFNDGTTKTLPISRANGLVSGENYKIVGAFDNKIVILNNNSGFYACYNIDDLTRVIAITTKNSSNESLNILSFKNHTILTFYLGDGEYLNYYI